MTWFKILMDYYQGRCTTDDCLGVSEWRLEVDGTGSDYCGNCKAKIEEEKKDEPSFTLVVGLG